MASREHASRSFGDLLRDYRIGAGLTQEALAEKAGLSVHGIQKLERGVTHPFRDTVARLVGALSLAEDDASALRASAGPVRRHGTAWAATSGSSQPRHNLPEAFTSLVGREEELQELQPLLGRHRLVTLVGTGGCGKTRLALEVARIVIDAYPDGVWLVELAPITDPALVTQQIGAVLGIREAPGRDLLDSIVSALQSRRLLLLLDNCEHLLDACALAAERILQACAGARVLATSREAMHIASEMRWRVASLGLPPEQQTAKPASVASSPAVRLFVERARAAQPHFALTDHNAQHVARICRRLDGIPLALELAAARTGVLTPKQLDERLDQRFRLLAGGSRTTLPRQQTLQAAMDWSYQLLSRVERRLFERLSVFAGGWSLDAAEHVCSGADLPHDTVLDLLSNLVDKSLVVVDQQPAHDNAESRFHFLETVREYARLKQASRGAAASNALQQRHATYFAEFARALNPTLTLAFDAEVEQLDREHDNIRAALRWCIDGRSASLGLRIALAMQPCWFWRGMLGEGSRWFDDLLALADSSAPVSPEGAIAPRQRAIAAASAAPFVGNRGDALRARSLAEESVRILEEIEPGSPLGAQSLVLLGISVWVEGDLARATELELEALRRARAAHSAEVTATALMELGRQALCAGQYVQATGFLADSARSLPPRGWLVEARRAEVAALLGRTYYLNGAHDEARAHLHQALELIRANRTGGYVVADVLDWTAALACALGRPLDAAHLFGAAEGVWQSTGAFRWPPMIPNYERDVAELRQQLEPEQLERARRSAVLWSAAEALDYALSLTRK